MIEWSNNYCSKKGNELKIENSVNKKNNSNMEWKY